MPEQEETSNGTQKFARRDVILPAVVFLLTFVVALFKSAGPK